MSSKVKVKTNNSLILVLAGLLLVLLAATTYAFTLEQFRVSRIKKLRKRKKPRRVPSLKRRFPKGMKLL